MSNIVSFSPSDLSEAGAAKAKWLNPGERRFRDFASVEVATTGESFMTPRDFLDCMVQDRPRPRIKSTVSGRSL